MLPQSALLTKRNCTESGQAAAVSIAAWGGGQVAFALLLPVIYRWPVGPRRTFGGLSVTPTETPALVHSAALNLIHVCNKKQFCNTATFFLETEKVYLSHVAEIL